MAPQRDAGADAEAELPEYAGHYRLESRLGSGGMGVVHLARSTSGMRVAVKVVHATYARDPEFRGRFRQEVAAARRVSGAFTAPVVDADPEAGRPWMATLFIPGPTLSEQVKRNGPMDEPQLRRLMAGLAEALRDIHRVGVVHRDLKPSNVLLAEDGPKVIDFGISRPKDSELRTETGKLIGTPPYMAPEQFRRPREVGPAADVFTLGSLMVHAATGRGPFDSDSPYVVAYQVVHDEPDLTGVPDSLAPLVLRCLAKEPEDRPTPDELMRELRSVAAAYDTQVFIPAPRTERAETPAEAGAEPAPRASVEPSGPSEPSEPSERSGRVLRRLGKRSALVAGAVGLAVVGSLVAVQAFGGSEPAGTPTAQSAPGGFGAWEAVPAAQGGGMPQCSYAARRLLCARPGVVFALDPADGSTLWRHPVEETVRSEPPVVSGGLVQPEVGLLGPLEALDPATGEPEWQEDMPAYDGLRTVGDMLLLTRADGMVTGVDSSSGRTRWAHRIPGQAVPYFTSFAGERHPAAYATSQSADGRRTHVTAVDPAGGDVRWDTELAGALTPVGTADGSVFLVVEGATYGDVTAVVRYTPATGATRRVTLPIPVEQASASAGVRGDTVYLMGAGGSLVAVDMAAEKQAWRLETGVSRGSAPVSDGRHVYVTAPDGRLLGVDARKGKLLGQTRPRLGADSDTVPASLPAPLLAGGHVYAGAPDGTVFGVAGRDPGGW
ncbi:MULTISPECIES: serine/threonine-protein kinase [Streptomyces]|uniref:Serine/threonine protein kinase n=1 Tax=Streptomyces coelicolor (strain ATCC BAA-471 / A3(2) / M145) TaxID=100226 RepID=Q9X8G8_STRCO|nr:MULTISPECIES: serine/threonine-protein kinase [Streptomyces]MDX2930666.1 PQQ-binding-like beta-propeller repeat protein [Streptomyces sp. NRRL_B-16638]MDX3411707.1 PQQ-binding-like beta-propeller repeat protein [Streptomyces sp. ME02-6977A]MYU42866.1 PQQ-binding-like beta-propeller repeat protein [Streptomyces sp. SID7813]NSL84101.1 PQQ-binding-like beta-propeller repeat protein [Streptomyces coelicolor]QFI43401.1 PQQ-binding-like beta-propeller repeat protein [Streptomyces coelicolor A3(2)